MNDLNEWGWNESWQEKWQRSAFGAGIPARVLQEWRGVYVLRTARGEIHGIISGRLRHDVATGDDRPAVGDWLCAEPDAWGTRALIHAILRRETKVSRKVAGRRVREQVAAANVDHVFLVSSLNREFNVRRLERYLTLVRAGGARPVVLLNKSDLCEDLLAPLRHVRAAAGGVPVHILSALQGVGLLELEPYLAPGRTVALLGSSGVGKSTLINRLLGRDLLPTAEIRSADDRGRHTTTHRRLLQLPGGGMIIDTPGLRELQLWSDTATEGDFDDIRSLSEQCRFRDCGHQREPGCAVRRAAEEGTINPERLASYEKQRKELHYLARRKDAALQAAETLRWRKIHKEARRSRRERGRD